MTSADVVELIARFAVHARAPVRTGTNVTSVRRTDDGYRVTTSDGEIRVARGGHRKREPATGRRCRHFAERAAAGRRAADAVRVPQPDPTPRRRRARRGRVGHRRAAGGRAEAIGTTGDPLGRGACTAAANVSRPRRPVVDGRVRRLGPAVRRGRRSHARAAATVAAARRNARANDARPQRADGDGRRAGGPLGGRPRRPRALLRRSAKRVLAGRPEDGTAARCLRRVGSERRAGSRGGAPERFAPTEVPRSARLELDLRSGEIRAIVWATGFRPDYGWLDVPVVDAKGQLRHDGGVVDSPGLYALGLPVLRRRKSTFIHGIEDDAREVIDHLSGYLADEAVGSDPPPPGRSRCGCRTRLTVSLSWPLMSSSRIPTQRLSVSPCSRAPVERNVWNDHPVRP